MSDSKPAILIMQPHLGVLAPLFEAEFTVWRLWAGPPLEAAGAIRALLVAGEFPIDKSFAESLPHLGLIACFTAGYDGVDVDWARARGLKVSHSPGVNHEDVADHAMGLVLAAARRIAEGDRIVRAGAWKPTEKTITGSLAGQRLGVVGLGAIGEGVARRAEAFGLSVSWWGPRAKPRAKWPRAGSLVELARDSDILVVAARADATNSGLISAEVIEALGPNGLLVNVARGQLVDEDALIAALKDSRLGMAALDVFVEEPTAAGRWADVPNTVLTPHTAGATTAAVPKMVALTLENLRRFFAGEALANPVVE
ncbi:MAG TPA: 2-hydroxyacid dehydrogenase [Caulobacteraceae bacterium]|jgi:lactate dehydrogenase-like 2-hydroxyacid dehydrogenase|nr:2-hydroxyacid dehydrogenase [Caulobacteraceae bacterium]